jgi:hypothetical protein
VQRLKRRPKLPPPAARPSLPLPPPLHAPPRFYRGLLPALFQGPLSRFGDTAANAGALALLDSYEATVGLPTSVKTLAASFAAGIFRIFLMPVDACKTIMQVGRRCWCWCW